MTENFDPQLEIWAEFAGLALEVELQGDHLWSQCSFDELCNLQGHLFAPLGAVCFGFEEEDKEPAEVQPAETTVGYSGLRLRVRGRQTRTLEALGVAIPGWWEDLSSFGSPANRALAFMRSHLGDSGAKVGQVQLASTNEVDGDSAGPVAVVQVLFSAEEGSRWLWVCPELLAKLYTIRLFRPISEGLLASMRGKSRLWAQERGLSVENLSRVLPGTLALAALPTPDEVVSLGALRGTAGQWSSEVLGALSRGTLTGRTKDGSWWDVLHPFLRFGGSRGSFADGRGCPTITLPK